MNKWIKYGLFALVALLVLAAIAKRMGWIASDDSTRVSIEESEKRTITETVLANGKIIPEKEVKISSEISGEIIELLVKEGDSILEGDLMMRINPEIAKASLDRSLANLNNSKASLNNSKARLAQTEANFNGVKLSFERNKKLYKDKVISSAEFEAAEANYLSGLQEIEAARQSVKGAEYGVRSSAATMKEVKENVVRTSLYSPIDGIVTRLNVELGERVVGTAQMAGTELMRVADLSSMQANVDVSEADIVNVEIGDTTEIEVDAYPDLKFIGLVTEIAHSANNTAGGMSDAVTNFGVKINMLPSSYADLSAKKTIPFRPGLSASVEIITNRKEGVISVPIQAVTARVLNSKGKVKGSKSKKDDDEEEDGGAGEKDKDPQELVFLVENGKAVSRLVKTGAQDDNYFEIIEGLKEGEEVITGPFSEISKKMFDDKEVKIVEKSKLFEK